MCKPFMPYAYGINVQAFYAVRVRLAQQASPRLTGWMGVTASFETAVVAAAPIAARCGWGWGWCAHACQMHRWALASMKAHALQRHTHCNTRLSRHSACNSEASEAGLTSAAVHSCAWAAPMAAGGPSIPFSRLLPWLAPPFQVP
jgi:hypothetical protein